MDPRGALRWLNSASASPPARANRIVFAFVAASAALSTVLSEHYRKDNGIKRREAVRVQRELVKHSSH